MKVGDKVELVNSACCSIHLLSHRDPLRVVEIDGEALRKFGGLNIRVRERGRMWWGCANCLKVLDDLKEEKTELPKIKHETFHH